MFRGRAPVSSVVPAQLRDPEYEGSKPDHFDVMLAGYLIKTLAGAAQENS